MTKFFSQRWSRGLVVVAMITGATIISANLACAAFFTGRVLPGVKVGGVDIGGLNRAQAQTVLARSLVGYHFQIKIGSHSYPFQPADLGLSYDINRTYQDAYDVGRVGAAEALDLVSAKSAVEWSYNLDEAKFKGVMTRLSTENSNAPTNPTVIVNGTTPTIVPGRNGFGASLTELSAVVRAALAFHDDGVMLQPATIPPTLTDAQLMPYLTQAKSLMTTSIELDDASSKVFHPAAAIIATWLVLDESGDVPVWTVDASRVAAYVKTVADQVDVPPTNLNITLVNGVEKARTGGVNGSVIDRGSVVATLAATIKTGRSLKLSLPHQPAAFKTLTNNTIDLNTPKYIEVNLSTQHLWAYQDHVVVFESPVTSGATGAGYPTVTGLFAIYTKERNRWLNGYQLGYNYDVYVQYWMPFYKDYGLHDASWRSSFGGPDYYYNGSHGCVNLPVATAAWLWDWDEVGTPVWVHN